MAFREDLPALAPPYWQGPSLELLTGSAGAALDAQAELVLDGRRQAIPYSAGVRLADGRPLQCEPYLLPLHAAQRGIQLYATEPEASRRVRVSRWLDLHARRGTHRGELEHVQPYFLGSDGLGVLPRMRIVHQPAVGTHAVWHSLSGSYDTGGAGLYSVHKQTPSNWDFDGLYRWSRWWAIVYTPGTVLAGTTWDGGAAWGDGAVWDGAPADVCADLVAMFLDWKGAHSQLAGVILAHDLASFEPTATPWPLVDGTTTLPAAFATGVSWGHIVDPATLLPTRLSTATFIYDRYH